MRVRPVVCGLDLSLTCPAACVIPDGWRLGDWPSLVTLRLDLGPVPATMRERVNRIIKIVGRMRDHVLVNGATHVGVENYAFSRKSSSVTKLAELGGYARVEFFTYGRLLREVPSSQARMLLLRKLPRKDAKVAVQLALFANGAPRSWDDNDCDAFAVANFMLSELGLPFVCLA